MKLFLVPLTIAIIALSSCETGIRTAENTTLQAQAKLIDKHQGALRLLLELSQEGINDKVSAHNAKVQAKNTKLNDINKSLPILNGEALTAAAEEKNALLREIKELADTKKGLEKRQQQIVGLLQEIAERK